MAQISIECFRHDEFLQKQNKKNLETSSCSTILKSMGLCSNAWNRFCGEQVPDLFYDLFHKIKYTNNTPTFQSFYLSLLTSV